MLNDEENHCPSNIRNCGDNILVKCCLFWYLISINFQSKYRPNQKHFPVIITKFVLFYRPQLDLRGSSDCCHENAKYCFTVTTHLNFTLLLKRESLDAIPGVRKNYLARSLLTCQQKLMFVVNHCGCIKLYITRHYWNLIYELADWNRLIKSTKLWFLGKVFHQREHRNN